MKFRMFKLHSALLQLIGSAHVKMEEDADNINLYNLKLIYNSYLDAQKGKIT